MARPRIGEVVKVRVTDEQLEWLDSQPEKRAALIREGVSLLIEKRERASK